ncbi:Tuberous sclerosis 1 protein [Rutstroemia sp. NJR-2017a WRK4]|nr:Tuberous sclerosis 1 protein [Rutstroemia sp. NJR-2017a WRK4]
MSSGSLKDLSKSITAVITTSTSLPLPDDLVQIIQNYLEKHASHDEADAQKLQEELLSIYEKDVRENPSRYAAFLSILGYLRIAIKGSGRLLQWWDKLCIPVLGHLGEEKGLATEARSNLLDVLIYDEDEGHIDDAVTTSDTVAENLLATWLAKNSSGSVDFNEKERFVAGQLKLILITFGRKRPKDFLTTINKFFVKRESRILTLSLLCEFIRHQPPRLHQLLQTPLFENLLRCLQIDTSTRVVSLAMTALIMFLPHIPASLSKHLPALFNIYSRMLFWDRQRKVEEGISADDADERSTHSSDSWTKLSQILDNDDVSVPELLHYYTFLYGLYPMNFMSYIRKPQKFLRHQGFPGADDLEVDPMEIRQRSEPFRQVHLLHPNFFSMTIDQELSDTNRWVKSEASDVVTECMALYIPGYTHQTPLPRSQQFGSHADANPDVPEQPLAEQNTVTPYQSRPGSWRYTTSTAVASPEGLRNSLLRRSSFTSQSIPSMIDSPVMRPEHQPGSPTLPAHLATSPSHTQLHEMLNSQRAGSARGLYQTLTNESVQSLALSHQGHDSSSHVDSYLQSLVRSHAPRSPSIRPGTNDSTKLAYLQRELMLLKNDLNFERYLKQQHLTHIGQLRRKAIREARVEAETQNLINSNRILRSKLEDTKRTIIQMKKESEKSRNHSRKWEADLTTKLRTLKDEQKKWILEGDQLRRDLAASKHDILTLRKLLIAEEAKVISASQKVQLVESNYEELKRLRGEVEELTTRLRKYEAREVEMDQTKQDEEQAHNTIDMLNIKLAAKDAEISRLQATFDQRLAELDQQRGEKQEGQHESALKQLKFEEALVGSRKRTDELKRAHSNLLKRYAKLQQEFLEISTGDRVSDLLSDGQPVPFIPLRDHRRKANTMPIDLNTYEGLSSSAPFQHNPATNYSPRKLDTYGHRTPTSPSSETRSPVHGYGERFGHANSFGPPSSSHSDGVAPSSASDRDSFDVQGKPKVKPQNEIRLYGRGGVQNISKPKKDKDKNGKKDGSSDAEDKPPKKKGSGLGGSLRGIRGFV